MYWDPGYKSLSVWSGALTPIHRYSLRCNPLRRRRPQRTVRMLSTTTSKSMWIKGKYLMLLLRSASQRQRLQHLRRRRCTSILFFSSSSALSLSVCMFCITSPSDRSSLTTCYQAMGGLTDPSYHGIVVHSRTRRSTEYRRRPCGGNGGCFGTHHPSSIVLVVVVS